MDDELYFDLVWFFIAILIGFSLIFISASYFKNTTSPFYILQIKIAEFIKIFFENIWDIIFSPFMVVLIIAAIVVVYLILFFREISRRYSI